MSTENQNSATTTAATATLDDARAAIAATRWGYLAIIREDGTPTVRPIGCIAPANLGPRADVYFSTPRDSVKDKALHKNPLVNFYFEPSVSEVAAYQGVSLIGNATEVLENTPEYADAIASLSAQSPFFKTKVETGKLPGTILYRIRTTELRFSDYKRFRTIVEIPLA